MQDKLITGAIKDIIGPYKYPVKYLNIADSLELAYIDEGDGDQVLIFIHGLASYIPAWDRNIGVLKGKYRCIAIDLPGYGKSSKAKYNGTMSFHADVVSALIDKLALENVILAGHSMGGQIAIKTALKYPEKIEKLALLAPAGFETFTERDKEWLRNFYSVASIMNTSEEQVRMNYKYNFYEFPEIAVEEMIQERLDMREASDFELYCHSIVQNVAGMLDEPVFNELKELRQPTLVVYGENDFLIPNRILHNSTTAEIATRGVEQIKNARLELIPECGHFLQFEKPDEFNKILLDFLE